MSLLKELQQITERTYQQFSGVNLEQFIIGRMRFGDLSNNCSEEAKELSDVARLFMRTLNDKLYLAIYFADDMIATLEKNDPRKGLSEMNIYPFMVFLNQSKKLENFDRFWLRFHLFERGDFSYPHPKLASRYYETNQLGEKYTRFLDSIPTKHRLDEIRRFREMSYPVKARYIRMLP